MPSVMDRIVRLLWPKYLRLRLDVNALQAQMGRVMAKQEDFDARMGLMDAATNEIASDLQALRDELKAGGAVSDANLATLDAKIARLQVLGADPIDPVPTE